MVAIVRDGPTRRQAELVAEGKSSLVGLLTFPLGCAIRCGVNPPWRKEQSKEDSYDEIRLIS